MSGPLSAADIAFVKSLVIYEDDDLIAFNKPSGLSSQGGRIKAHTLDDLMVAFAKASGNQPRLVHRLDRDTSGVILTARTKPAAGFLGRSMMTRRIMKTYVAIVTPEAPQPPQGTISLPLRREEIGRESYMRISEPDHPDAQEAQTLYRTLARGEGAALVEARPRTGRMHQIRAHLSALQRPIAGDVRYGGALVIGGEPAGRLMLHALTLEFPHPAGGFRKITAPPPADFMAALAAVGIAWNTEPAAVIP